MEGEQRVKVYIRIRPTAAFANESIEIHSDKKAVTVHCRKDERRGYINNQVLDWKFSFDGLLHNASQEATFKTCASGLVTKALDGYNSTIFAYGETGAGKTYTMTGTNEFKYRGIIPRSLTQLYNEISKRDDHDINIRISYMQIYGDKIYDLLEPNGGNFEQLAVTEDTSGATYVKGLTCLPAVSEEEALSLLFEGESNRIISHHQLNRFSSRSHCIFSVFIESHSRTISGASYTLSRLNLVDLAGSERIGKTKCEGKVQEEALHINKSLTFLEQVVIALAEEGREHVPFRQSKLTHVLKDSLGGKCQTVMIGNIWGEIDQLEETLSTLRFGNRVTCIPNQPAKNIIYDPFKVCKSLEREISDLRKELSMYDTLTNRRQITYEPLSETQLQEIKGQVRKFVDGEIEDIEIINVRQVKQVFEQFKELVKQAEEEKRSLAKKKKSVQEDVPRGPSRGGQNKAEVTAAIHNGDLPLVGETDGQNFGVGVAPNSAKAQHLPAASNTKKTKSRKGKPDSSGGDIKRSPSPTENAKQSAENQDKPSSTGQLAPSPTRPRTPPPKSEAFEQYRNERGKELNTVFLENKDIVKSKKIEAKETIAELNKMKNELDECKAILEAKRRDRELEDQIEHEENPVIEEDEFVLLKRISDLKLSYRTKFETLENLRSDLAYCENLVHQCRQRLLSEFEAWYADCFMPIDSEGSEKLDDAKSDDSKKGFKSVRIVEDEQEKFDRLQQELLMENPESVPFYNAKLQTERRQLYTGSGTKRKPGGVVAQVRNKPPTTLTVK